ncbi:MAG: hypothetical protein FWF94_05295 [Oscillospiraceae bacterium]|nr:hypothetical protein [Oscillospiraceae bacterium]
MSDRRKANIEKITAIISRYSGVHSAQIEENTLLMAQLNMESMSFIDMVCEFESQFARRIHERDFRRFTTVGKIADYLDSEHIMSDTNKSEASDAGENGFYESNCIVLNLTKSLAQKVPELVTAVYGKQYPAKYLYDPDELWAKTVDGEIYPHVAVNGEGRVIGMISLIRLSVNLASFELGQLMVIPEYRGSDVAELLISDIAEQELRFGVIYCESVTIHKFSQRSCITGGFCDTALKINMMPAYKNDSTERICCVVSCIERGETDLWAYLPLVYRGDIKYALDGLSPRLYRNASDIAPNNPTSYTIDDEGLKTNQYVVVSVAEIGSDAEESVKSLNSYAAENMVKAMVVNIPLSCPHNGAMIKALRNEGFFFGGVMPRWFPDSDAILMQKLYSNAPDWEQIKLFSDKIQIMSGKIKNDIRYR